MVTRWRMPPESWWGYSSMPPLGGRQAHRAEQLDGRGAGLAAPQSRSARAAASVICWPIFTTGLSDVIGSWKTIAISTPQRRRICLTPRPARSPALEPHLAAGGHRGPLGQEVHDRAGQHRLARARLADDPERAAPLEGQRARRRPRARCPGAWRTTCAGRATSRRGVGSVTASNPARRSGSARRRPRS